jgi:hypothetical protein
VAAWFDDLGLLGPDDAFRFALGQGPNIPGGGGPAPLMSGLDPNTVSPMPTIQGPLSALASMPDSQRKRVKPGELNVRTV